MRQLCLGGVSACRAPPKGRAWRGQAAETVEAVPAAVREDSRGRGRRSGAEATRDRDRGSFWH